MSIEKMDDGATPVTETKSTAGECMGVYRHKWQWLWEHNPKTGKHEMTDKHVCSSCLAIRNQDGLILTQGLGMPS